MDKGREKNQVEKALDVESALIDVRNAFRLLSVYQQSVLGIVFNIRDKTIFKGYNIVGKKDWYSNLIRHCSQDQELKVGDKMWGLDFLYGHFFEYRFVTDKKQRDINGKTIDMSVFQVSDDGYFYATNKENDIKMMPDEYEKSSEDSHSYIILNMSIYKDEKEKLWLYDPKSGKRDKEFLWHFVRGDEVLKMKDDYKDCFIYDDKGESFIIIKKYEMQRFENEKLADEVIEDFDNIVKEATGESILLKNDKERK